MIRRALEHLPTFSGGRQNLSCSWRRKMIEPLAGQTLPVLPFVVCDSAGRILRSGSCPAEMVLLQAGEGERFFAGNADGSTQYILGLDLAPAAVARPVSPVTIDKTTVAADGTDAVVVSSIGVGQQSASPARYRAKALATAQTCTSPSNRRAATRSPCGAFPTSTSWPRSMQLNLARFVDVAAAKALGGG